MHLYAVKFNEYVGMAFVRIKITCVCKNDLST